MGVLSHGVIVVSLGGVGCEFLQAVFNMHFTAIDKL